MTLIAESDRYIETYSEVLSTTIAGYKPIKENAFKTVMNIQISKIDSDIMQRVIKEKIRFQTL